MAKISKKENIAENQDNLDNRLEDYALELINKGRISIGKAAELLDRNIYDLQEIAREKGIVLSADEEAVEESEKTAKELVKKLKKQNNLKL